MASAITLDYIARFGITEIYSHPDAKVDIVLVHGLNGHPKDTWRADNGVFWPSRLLPRNVLARVLVYGYDANVHAFGGGAELGNVDTIHHNAETLLTNLAQDRNGEEREHRPIIFVAHSLGGILVKRALELSSSFRPGDDLRSIYPSTFGVMFLGTPSNGIDLAKWDLILDGIARASIPKKVLESEPHQVKTLQRSRETLEDINLKFLNIYDRFRVCMVHENLTTDLKGTRSLIVDQVSASPLLSNVQYFGIEATHLGMCKFGSKHSPGYSRLSSTLKSWVEESPPVIQSYWEKENKLRNQRREAQVSLLLGYHEPPGPFVTERYLRSSDPSELVSNPGLKYQPKSEPSSSVPPDSSNTELEQVRARFGRWGQDPSLHRTVKKLEKSRYRDTVDAYRRSTSAADPRVSYDAAQGYFPKSSSHARGRTSGQSGAALALADINSGSLPPTKGGVIADRRRSSSLDLKGRGSMMKSTSSYASVVAGATTDTATRFKEPTLSGIGPEQSPSASASASGRPLISAMASLQKFPTSVARRPSSPNALPPSPFLGPSLDRRGFPARRRYSQENMSLQPDPYQLNAYPGIRALPIDPWGSTPHQGFNSQTFSDPTRSSELLSSSLPSDYLNIDLPSLSSLNIQPSRHHFSASSYYPGRPELSNQAGGYTSQPMSRDPSGQSARSNQSANSPGQIERRRRRPSIAESEPAPQLPTFTPRIAPTSYEVYNRMRQGDSPSGKDIGESNSSNLDSLRGKKNSSPESVKSEIDTALPRKRPKFESARATYIESLDEWIPSPKPEKPTARPQPAWGRSFSPKDPSFSPLPFSSLPHSLKSAPITKTSSSGGVITPRAIEFGDFPELMEEFELPEDKIIRTWIEREREAERRKDVGLELKTAQGGQNMSGFTRRERRSDSHGSIINDPYDPKSHMRILGCLNKLWERSQRPGQRGAPAAPKAASNQLREALLDFFVLPRDGSITVCKWEAPKVFRQWGGKLATHNQISNAEKSAAFRRTLLILGSNPYFEATTLEDFIARGSGLEGNTLLELVIETLMSANEEPKLLERESRQLEASYACSKDYESIEKDFYQLLLFEGYIILGCGSQSPSHKVRSQSLLRIAQALRSPELPNSPGLDESTPTSLEADAFPQALISRPLSYIVNENQTLNFQAYTLLPLQPLEVSFSSCWTNLFKPAPTVVQFSFEESRAAGLKLPFDLMVHLAAIQAATLIPGDDEEKDDTKIEIPGARNDNSERPASSAPVVKSPPSPPGIVLHGFFTALIPIEESAGAVRWHLEYNDPSKGDSELQLIDPYNLDSTSGNWLRVADYTVLEQKECILGWWEEANIMLGTKELANNVRFSRPSSTKSRSLHLKEISAIGQIGASTVVPISIQAGANFQFVNNVQHFGRENMYAIALMKMANDIALVYDAESHCGWLVPKLSLVLHMSHTFYDTVLHGDVSTDPIPYAEPSSDGAAAALAALRGKGDTVLYTGGSDGDILLSSILATIHANICEANKTHEASKPGRLLATQYLNMIEEPAAGSDITITKTPSSIKAWLGIIDRVGCVMVCAGLGEAIKPVVMLGKCTKGCDKLPRGKGYLAAHFWCLRKLLQRRGWDLVALSDQPVSINDNQIWSLRGNMFPCCMLETEHLSRWDNRNVILQQVVKQSRWRIRSSQLQKNPAPKVTGAAVFGIPSER